MKKRLRKKFRKGEFTELGFTISLYCDLDPEHVILDKFIDIIERYNAGCGGGGDIKKYSLYVSKNRKSITEEERLEIIEKSKKIKGVCHVIALELSDGWNGNSEEYFSRLEVEEGKYEKSIEE